MLGESASTAEVDLNLHFTDPDGHDLTYSAVSLHSGVVGATLRGSTVTLTRIGAGTGEVSASAVDPYEGSVSGTITVSTGERTLLFRDEFDSLASVWAPDEDTYAEIRDGRVFVQVIKEPNYVGYMPRRTGPVHSFQLKLNIENLTDKTWGGVIMNAISEEVGEVWFLYGADLSRLIAGSDRTNFAVVAVTPDGSFTWGRRVRILR